MKKIYRYLIIFVLLATATFSILYVLRSNITQKQLDRYASYITDGDKEVLRRDYGKALSSYGLAAETVPKKIDAYQKIVDLLILKNRFDDAKDVVEKSTTVLSISDKASLNRQLANQYYLDNQIEKAEKYYLDADRLRSTEQGYLGLTKVYLKLNNSEKAKKALNRVKAEEGPVALEKDLLYAYLDKMDSKSAKGRLDRWDLSLESDKELVSLANRYLSVLGSLETDDLYNRALLAREYINAGYPVLAIEVLESEVEKMKEYPDGLYFLGRAYYDSGKYSSAVDILNRSLGFDVYSDDIYILLARIDIINGDQNVAFENYEKAISFANTSGKIEIYMEYIDILLSEKAYSTAKSTLDKLVESKLNVGIWPQLKYLEMYYEQKLYVQMKSILDTLSRTSTLTDLEKMEYLRWHITYDIENDKLAGAKENLSILRSLDRFNPYYYLLLGRVYLIENNVEKAKDEFNTAINYDLDGDVTDSAKRLLGRVE